MGLMFRTDLGTDSGMLFCYNSPQPMVFWMKNTRIPLDIVFFDPDLRIVDWIEGMKPGYGLPEVQLPRYAAKVPAQYALELASGSIKARGLALGDRLIVPLPLLHADEP